VLHFLHDLYDGAAAETANIHVYCVSRAAVRTACYLQTKPSVALVTSPIVQQVIGAAIAVVINQLQCRPPRGWS
jgi:hypothetical protein